MSPQPHLSQEKTRLVLIGIFGLVIGWVSGSIWMGLAITFFFYSCWLIYQARQVDVWLQKGAHRNAAPDTDGVVGNIEKLIFRRKQSDKARKARMIKILGWYNRSAAALPDATVVTNNNYEIIWANDAARTYLGIRGTRDAGQRIDNLVRDTDFQKYIKDNDTTDPEIEIKSPSNKNLSLSIRRVAYAENMYLFSARDVSQRVQLRETRSAFVANASHELKTPLTLVNGYLELLSADESLPQAAREKISIAEDHAIRMRDIVTDLLTLSKLENQQLENSKLTPVAVGEILSAIAEDFKINKSGRNHIFETDIDIGLLLHGSESEVKSVCTNLCFNAVQHTPAGTTINIEWKPTAEGGAQMIIRDDGPGISAQHLLHITERFYRVDNEHSRESGGTGLGLSIVKHIVNRHQGLLEINSEPGQGTSFVIRFPAEKVLLDSSQLPLSDNLLPSAYPHTY